MKLKEIKTKLAALIAEVKCEAVKTDKAVLIYEAEELVEGIDVFVEDEDGNRTPAEDGEYITEDNKVITVADGKVVSIIEKAEEPAEEEAPAEENVEAEETDPEGTEGTTSEDAPKENEEVVDEVAELREKIDALTVIVEELVATIETLKTTTEEKFSKMSQAKPAVDEFERVASMKTGDAKVDKLLSAWGK